MVLLSLLPLVRMRELNGLPNPFPLNGRTTAQVLDGFSVCVLAPVVYAFSIRDSLTSGSPRWLRPAHPGRARQDVRPAGRRLAYRLRARESAADRAPTHGGCSRPNDRTTERPMEEIQCKEVDGRSVAG